MLINQIAGISGVSVRTLRYYDSIGLLSPVAVTDAGYRQYDQNSLARLQQILFFRELGFTLHEITEIMNNPNYDMRHALTSQKQLLIMKRDRMERMLSLVESLLKGETDMSFDQFKTDEIDNARQQYAQEVKERWGDTNAYREYSSRPQDGSAYSEADSFMLRFAQIRNLRPDGAEAQSLVKEWQDFITNNMYTCTDEILGCLGQMYTSDERFKSNIDRHGEGTADFIAAAISYYCNHA